MKKSILNLLILTMILVVGMVFTSCGNSSDVSEDVAKDATATLEEFSDDADLSVKDWDEISSYGDMEVEEFGIGGSPQPDGSYGNLFVSNKTPKDIIDYYEGLMTDAKIEVVDEDGMEGYSVEGFINGHTVLAYATYGEIWGNYTESTGTCFVEFYMTDTDFVEEAEKL